MNCHVLKSLARESLKPSKISRRAVIFLSVPNNKSELEELVKREILLSLGLLGFFDFRKKSMDTLL